MDTQKLFRALYGGDAVADWCVLWRADTKASTWIHNARDMESYVEDAKRKHFDSYFGVCLQKEKVSGRGAASGVSVVPGVWADIDFCDKPGLTDQAKKKNYPTRDAATKALAMMPATPSLLISTGGGLHAYWLFDQPFVIESETSRDRVAGVVRSWQAMLKAKLMKLGGYGLDSTFDLARVLRIPGTPHTKHPGDLVKIIESALARYTLKSLEEWLTQGAALQPASEVAPKSKSLKKTPTAAPVAFLATNESDPPGTKFDNLMEASHEFAALWRGKVKRASPSEYDMSLANYAVNAGWSDAEAAALLVAFARKWNPSHLDKLLRVNGGVQDYLQLTIGKAHDRRSGTAVDSPRTNVQAGRATEFISRIDSLDDSKQVAGAREQFIGRYALTEKPETLAREFDSELSNESVRRRSPLESTRRALAIPTLIEIRKNGTQDALIEFVINDPNLGRVTIALGSSYDVINVPKKVRTRLMESGVGVKFPLYLTKPMQWDPIAQQLMRAAVFYKVPGIAQQMASAILEVMGTLNGEYPGAARSGEDFETFVLRETRNFRSPPVFWQEGKPELWINTKKLRNHLSEFQGRVFNDEEFFACLRAMEFKETSFQKRIDKKNTKVRLWEGVLPESAAYGD